MGDRFASRGCRWGLGMAQGMTGDLDGAVAQLREVVVEADAAHDVIMRCSALFMLAVLLGYQRRPDCGAGGGPLGRRGAAELGGFYPGLAYAGLTVATVAAGDIDAADDAIAAGWQHLSIQPKMAAIWIVIRHWPRWRAGI